MPGGGLTATGVTLKMLAMNAYSIAVYQIFGAPNRVGTERWDIEAKTEGVEGRLPPAQFNVLLRHLIEDRGENSAAPQQSLRAKSVTYVLGTICYPCVRVEHIDSGAAGGIRTHDIQNHNRIRGILRDTEASLPIQNSKIGSPTDTEGNGRISYNKLHHSSPGYY